MDRVVVIQQRVVIESCLLTARASLYLCDVCYAELNELGLVWGAFSFRPHNEPYASHSQTPYIFVQPYFQSRMFHFLFL